MAFGFDWTDKVNNQDYVMAEDVNMIAAALTSTLTQMSALQNTVNALIPRVGQIYMTTENVNPGTYLPGTTWEAWGSGRVPVGVDTGQTEFNTVGKTGGAKTHELAEAEGPPHTHRIYYNKTAGAQAVGTIVAASNAATSPENTNWYAVTQSSGGGQPHNNLQPYITCYMWCRTA